MAKYKVGDKVRIVSKNPNAIGFTDEMEKYLGKTLTVINVWERPYGLSSYNFKEATVGNPSMDLPRKVSHWNFAESWISGLAEPEREPCTVELYSDSKYVIDALSKGWVYGWQKKGWIKADKKPVLNVDLWQQLLPLLARHDVRLHWVKGHAENEKNNRCDQLAVAESKKFR